MTISNYFLYKTIFDKKQYYSFNIQDEFVLVEDKRQAAKLTLQEAELFAKHLGFYIGESNEQMD
jgi:hypothetical protein